MIKPEDFKSWFTEYSKTIDNWPTASQWHLVCKMVSRMEVNDTKPSRLVEIVWKDKDNDWPWFYVLDQIGMQIHLKGADYPDGSVKHDGDDFWCSISEIESMHQYISPDVLLTIKDGEVTAVSVDPGS